MKRDTKVINERKEMSNANFEISDFQSFKNYIGRARKS